MKIDLQYLFLALCFTCFASATPLLANHADRVTNIEHDSLELIALYNATDGPNWYDTFNNTWNTAWNLADPVSTWHGITLSEDGTAVTHIDLSSNNLLGDLPSLDFPLLKVFNLKFNNLSGILPNLDFPLLEKLLLSYNNITGYIPEYDFPLLVTLDLGYNELIGEIPVFDFPLLVALDLGGNELVGELPNFNFPLLESIDLNYNNLTGLIPEYDFPSLEVFTLRGNNLFGEIPVFDFPLLKVFTIGQNDFTGEIPNFDFPILEQLSLDNNDFTGEIPNFDFPVLESFNLSGNGLSGEIPVFDFPILEFFNIMNNDFTGEIPVFDFPLLTTFALGRNNFTGEIPNLNYPLLESLILGDNNLEGEMPTFNFPKLRELALGENDLTGEIPNFNFPLLTFLSLSHNGFTGEIPAFELPKLRSLYLQGNALTGDIPNLDSPAFETFVFYDNQLHGCYPMWFCNLVNVSGYNNPSLPDGGSNLSLENFCINPSSQFGLPCNDGDPSTIGEVIQPDCNCSTMSSIDNHILGTLFFDTLENCNYDLDEIPLNNWLITATSDSHTYYDVSDSLGQYQIITDTGTYLLHLDPPNTYWDICPAVQDSLLVFLQTEDSILLNIPAEGKYLCPIINVDISTPFLRRCFDNIYYVSYCNEGTAPAEDAYIEVDFDEFISVNSSTLPWSSQLGQSYTFDLGTVDIGECGTFQISTYLDCDSTLLGQTHCVEAHAFPDSICLPTNSFWDGSTIVVDGECEGDSIRFEIKNIGDDMDNVLDFIVIEDQIIHYTDDFQLLSQEVEEVGVVANGSTWRLEAEQAIDHPTNGMPSVAVEGCNATQGVTSLGFVNYYSQDDADPFVSIACQESVGSWDPNDKRGFPAGIGAEHIIFPETELEYHIRFQNTGTDTAFTVVIQDTISEFLNPASIRPGVSSHPYTWAIFENNVVVFSFENIMLPDSNINEAASHGFVKFKINQTPDNLPSTLIKNSAGIYFDFNEAVLTNETVHKIEERYFYLDTIYDVFCDTETYLEDTMYVRMGAVATYDFEITNIINVGSDTETFVDTTWFSGIPFEGVIYERDTLLQVHYTTIEGCDSLVNINLQLLANPLGDRSFLIYPNPSDGDYSILLDLKEDQEISIALYNSIGKLVVDENRASYMEGRHTISLTHSRLPDGVYWLEIQSSAYKWLEKIVFQKK